MTTAGRKRLGDLRAGVKRWRDKVFTAHAAALISGGGLRTRIGGAPVSALADISPAVAVGLARLDLASKLWAKTRVALGYSNFTEAVARAELDSALEALTDAERKAALARYRQALGDSGTKGVSVDDLVDLARREADTRFPPGAGQRPLAKPQKPGSAAQASPPAVAPPKGKKPAKPAPVKAPGTSTAFDDLDRFAQGDPNIAALHHAYLAALGTGDPKLIREATTVFQEQLVKHGPVAGMSKEAIERVRGAVVTVNRAFDRIGPGVTAKAAEAAYAAVRKRLSSLAPGDPIGPVWDRLGPWFQQLDLEKLIRTLANFPSLPAGLKGEQLDNFLKWRTNAAKGAAGEALFKNGPYREIWEQERRRAERFLASPAGEGFKLLPYRTPLRATTVKGNSFALSYDDAMLLVRSPPNEVIAVHAAQFKAGDSASLTALAQTGRDIVREEGKLLIDGVSYAIVRNAELPTHRTVVATQLGSGSVAAAAEELAGRELEIVLMLTDPEDLRKFADFLLEVLSAAK